jgi:hypothetical protein
MNNGSSKNLRFGNAFGDIVFVHSSSKRRPDKSWVLLTASTSIPRSKVLEQLFYPDKVGQVPGPSISFSNISSQFGTHAISGLSFGNGLWAAGAWTVAPFPGGQLSTSTDGLTWTTRISGTPVMSVTYKNSLWVCGENSGTIRTSTDAVTWTTRTSGLTSAVWGIDYGSSTNTWVASGGSVISTSGDNGVTWVTRTSTFGTSVIFSVRFGNGIFVAGGDAGQIRTSTDGVTWTTRTSNFGTSVINSIGYGNGIFVAVGAGGAIRTSTDGITWTARTSNTTNILRTASYADNLWIVGGNAGTILTSTDAVTWTTRTALSGSPAIYNFNFGNGLLIAGASSGVVSRSEYIRLMEIPSQLSHPYTAYTAYMKLRTPYVRVKPQTFRSPTIFGSSLSGYFSQGGNSFAGSTQVYKWKFDTDTVSTTTSSPAGMERHGGFSDPLVAGYFSRGITDTAIYKWAISSDTVTTSTNAPGGLMGHAGFANPSIAGYFNRGYAGATYYTEVYKWAFPNDTVSTTTAAPLSIAFNMGFSNPYVAGYFSRGYDGATNYTTVYKWAFPNDTVSTTTAALGAIAYSHGFSDPSVAGYTNSGRYIYQWAFPADTVSQVASLPLDPFFSSAFANAAVAGYISQGFDNTFSGTATVYKVSFPAYTVTTTTAAPAAMVRHAGFSGSL